MMAPGRARDFGQAKRVGVISGVATRKTLDPGHYNSLDKYEIGCIS